MLVIFKIIKQSIFAFIVIGIDELFIKMTYMYTNVFYIFISIIYIPYTLYIFSFTFCFSNFSI